MPARAHGRLTAAALVLSITTLATMPASAGWFTSTPPAELTPAAAIPVQTSPQLAEQSMRMDRMEEQMRQLNGRIDELSFQLRQLQELLKRAREDTEFRMKELEGGKKRSEAPSPAREPSIITTGPADAPADLDSGTADAPVELGNGFSIDAGAAETGAPPQDLGTIPAAPGGGSGPLDLSAIARGDDGYTMSDLAGPADTATGGPVDTPTDMASIGGGGDAIDVNPLPAPEGAEPSDTEVATAVLEEDPRAQYERAYGYIVEGNYQMAEAGFRQFLESNGSTPLAGDAHFWLGESLFARGQYRDAADSFLTTYRDFPKSSKAPDSLLKLGLSLEGLGEKDAACATYRELEKKFPAAPASLLQKVSTEKSKAGC